jgi:predicted nucleic acid-binding protein
MSVLLDSVILIDHLNGLPAASAYLRRMQGASISLITRAEVLSGPAVANSEILVRWLDRFSTLPLDRKAADLAAELRRLHRWRLPDAFQAALAQLHGLKLATRNIRDFPPERHAFVTVPYAVKAAR